MTLLAAGMAAVAPRVAAAASVFTDISDSVFKSDIDWMSDGDNLDKPLNTAQGSIDPEPPDTTQFSPDRNMISPLFMNWMGRMGNADTDTAAGQRLLPIYSTPINRMIAAHSVAEFCDLLPHYSTDHGFTDMDGQTVA